MKVLITVYFLLLSCSAYSLEFQEGLEKQVETLPASNIIPKINEFNISFKQNDLDKNFLFNNQLTLHKSARFNILVTANVSKSDAFEHNTAYSGSDLVNSKMIPTNNDLMPTIHSSSSETTHQYGLIGSYAVTSKWHVTGGLIYSTPSLSMDQVQSNINNAALIGTSYSF
jgi:hypothetical protein